MGVKIPENLLARSPAKAGCITPYVICDGNKQPKGTLDLYDPAKFFNFGSDGRPIHVTEVGINTSTGMSDPQWGERSTPEERKLSAQELSAMFQSNPWLQHIYLGNVSVLPNSQKKGYGSKLVSQALQDYLPNGRQTTGEDQQMVWGITDNIAMLKVIK